MVCHATVLLGDFADHPRELSRVSQVPFSCASFWQGLRFAVQSSATQLNSHMVSDGSVADFVAAASFDVNDFVFRMGEHGLDYTTETVVLRKKHNSNQSRSSQCHHSHLAMHLTHRYLTRRLLAHCHLTRHRHSQQQTSQRSQQQAFPFGSSSRISLTSWMVVALLQLGPNRSQIMGLPEPNRHWLICHGLGLLQLISGCVRPFCHGRLRHRLSLQRQHHLLILAPPHILSLTSDKSTVKGLKIFACGANFCLRRSATETVISPSYITLLHLF
jgi:hypothetical protein